MQQKKSDQFGSWLPFKRPCSFASPSFDGFAIVVIALKYLFQQKRVIDPVAGRHSKKPAALRRHLSMGFAISSYTPKNPALMIIFSRILSNFSNHYIKI